MPELPEVETVVRALNSSIKNPKIKKFSLLQSNLRTIKLPEDLRIFCGLEVQRFQRVGKYIICFFEHLEKILMLHLGMAGILTFGDRSTGKHDIFSIEFEDGLILWFTDVRRFGQVAFWSIEEYQLFCKKIAPDPLNSFWTEDNFYQLLKTKKSLIKVLLMDQSLISGIGNIYASEALFLAKILPTRRSCDILWPEAQNLLSCIKKVLQAGIDAKGASFKDFVQATGSKGSFQTLCSVYARKGLPCLAKDCDSVVEVVVLGGRTTFFCSVCQS